MPFRILISLCICVISVFTADAQLFAKQAHIKKIMIFDRAGGMGESVSITLEILPFGTHWRCFQIDSTSSQLNSNYNKSSSVRRQIATLSIQQIALLLKAISVTKPQFSWWEFGITPITLRKYLETKAQKYTPGLGDYINERDLKKIIKDLQDWSAMDLAVRTTIEIVTKDGKKIDVVSERQNTMMLPWIVNGVKTYDVTFSKFIEAAMGKEIYPNKERLRTIELNDQILEYLDGLH